MNKNVKKICEVVEDIKAKLTDCQYESILDNLMTLNNNKKRKYEAFLAYMTNLYDRVLVL
jgi:hypothetical protein